MVARACELRACCLWRMPRMRECLPPPPRWGCWLLFPSLPFLPSFPSCAQAVLSLISWRTGGRCDQRTRGNADEHLDGPHFPERATAACSQPYWWSQDRPSGTCLPPTPDTALRMTADDATEKEGTKKEENKTPKKPKENETKPGRMETNCRLPGPGTS